MNVSNHTEKSLKAHNHTVVTEPGACLSWLYHLTLPLEHMSQGQGTCRAAQVSPGELESDLSTVGWRTWPWILEDVLLHLRIDASAKLPSHASCHASVHHAAAGGQGRLRICCQLRKRAGRSRWGSWICTIVWWVGELLWSTLRKTGVPHLNWQSRWRRDVVPKTLVPHEHGSLLLYNLPLSMLLTVQFPLTLCQHLSIQGWLHRRKNIFFKCWFIFVF